MDNSFIVISCSLRLCDYNDFEVNKSGIVMCVPDENLPKLFKPSVRS